MAKTMTGVRLDDEMIGRLDRIALALGKRAAGIKVGTAEAMRACLDRGANALERELGIAPKPARKGAKPVSKPVAKTKR